MLFSSIPFLYYFLPAVVLIYFLVPGKLKNTVLLLFSLVFYGWGEPKYLALMVSSIILFYGCGLAIGKAQTKKWKKFWLLVSVVCSVTLLGIFKYADFFVSSFNSVTGLSVPLLRLALPIGISFYTFQCLSYTIDVYRGNVPAQKNPISFGAYVSLFPQLIAGPIVRYIDVARELDNRTHSWDDVALGLRRFLVGLAKKVIIADNFALLMKLFRESEGQSVVFYWMYAIAFCLNIYFDFSGYSDMAIGLGRIFGFRFLENFNLPYMATSITDFWRRWHISLSTFFRDYVYIPMGGNRRHRNLNLFVTWALTGLWHGASWNFLLWGLYFFVLLLIEKPLLPKITKVPMALRRIVTLFLLVIGWAIFYFTDFGRLGQALSAMFGFAGGGFWNTEVRIMLLNNLPLLLLCVLGSTPLPRLVGDIFGLICAGKESDGPKQKLYVAVTYAFCVALLVLSTISLVGSGFSAFLYYRF